MKRIFVIISVISVVVYLYFTILNFNNIVDFNVIYSALMHAQSQAGWTDTNGFIVTKMSVAALISIPLFWGLFMGAWAVSLFLFKSNDRVKAYERELEKTSIAKQSSTSKVDVLESKVKTLEKALSSVVDERKKLEAQVKSLNEEIERLNSK